MIRKCISIFGLILITGISCVCSVDAKTSVKRPEPIKKVEIKNGVVHVNNKPFFAIGTCMAAHHHKALKECGEAGFNLVQTWTYDKKDPLSYRQDIRDAYENGMYALVSFNGLENDIEMVKAVVKACKDEPGLLAYDLPDEPNLRKDEPADKPYLERPYRWGPSQLKEMYDAVKSIDKEHPVTITLAHGIAKDHSDYYPVTDIMCGDVYPVPASPMEVQAAYSDVIVKGCLGKPAWQYVQMSPVMPELKDKDRHPSIEEVRCLTYMSITHGITGVNYFAFQVRPWYDWRINESAPEYWAKWPGLLKELRSVSPFFMVPNVPGKVEVLQTEGSKKGPWGQDALHIALRKVKKEYLLIAVNGLNEKVSAELTLPLPLAKSGKVVSENRNINLKDNKALQDTWEPYAVHVYKFKSR